MNNAIEVVIATITHNGSAVLPFVIPSEAEGPAVLSMDGELHPKPNSYCW
jgi:hypothetical protein